MVDPGAKHRLGDYLVKVPDGLSVVPDKVLMRAAKGACVRANSAA